MNSQGSRDTSCKVHYFLMKHCTTFYSTFKHPMNHTGDKLVYDYVSLESNSILHTNTENFLHGFKTSMFRNETV